MFNKSIKHEKSSTCIVAWENENHDGTYTIAGKTLTELELSKLEALMPDANWIIVRWEKALIAK